MRPRVRDSERLPQLVAQETLILGVTEDLIDVMLRRGITSSMLARRLGFSERRLRRLMTGERDMTLRELAAMAHALGAEARVEVGMARA